jgi:hypothetical protein
MVAALVSAGFKVTASDIASGCDFLKCSVATTDAIVTNPPYALAQEFIEHSLKLVGLTAILLRTDFDHAKSRKHLFVGCPHFAKKLVLTKRIRWFEDSNGSPSFNHCWMIWDRKHQGPPTLAYH